MIKFNNGILPSSQREAEAGFPKNNNDPEKDFLNNEKSLGLP